MDKDDVKNFLNIIVTERMKAKSRIEELRWLQEYTESSNQELIDRELDRIAELDKLYKEWSEKLKD